jgi:hypothetical protein
MLAYELAFDPKGTFERPGFSISTTEHFFRRPALLKTQSLQLKEGSKLFVKGLSLSNTQNVNFKTVFRNLEEFFLSKSRDYRNLIKIIGLDHRRLYHLSYLNLYI